jgi:uncharacterized membrane protein YkgB
MYNILHRFRLFVERRGLLLLRISVGVIYFWFGFLKFFPDNAAEGLAGDTISWLSAGYIGKPFSIYALAAFECIIGLSILSKRFLNQTVPLMYLQMCGTILPLFIFPEKTWIHPFMPSLEGQYIIKNIVIIASGIIMGAMARGSKLITHPHVAKEARKKEERITNAESVE